MTDPIDRRRSSDQAISLLRDAVDEGNTERRAARVEAQAFQTDATRKLDNIGSALSAMTTTDALHGVRLTHIETWRTTEVDPAMSTLRDTMSQIKGGTKAAKFAAAGVKVIAGGGVAALFLKGAAWIMAALHPW